MAGDTPYVLASPRAASSSPLARALLRPADDSQLAAASAAAEELIGAVGFEPRDACAGRHFQPFENLAGGGVDPPHIALLAFPSSMPKLAVDPSDSGDDPVRL